MRRNRRITLIAAGSGALVPALVAGAVYAQAAPAASVAAAAPGICTSSSHQALAAKLSGDITAALRSRSSIVALTVADRRTGVVCRLQEGRHFDSASVVKVTILGALLRKALDQHRFLTSNEVRLTTAMITQSDNNAASALWAEVGRPGLQRFLDLAKMTETVLGPGGFWGLTQLTARDELTQLRLLTSSNSVLDAPSRGYALDLMSRVIASQRWGVPAGAPAGLTVRVKNGWLPRPTLGWRINSIGSFAGHGRDYMIAVLTENNPDMAYGVRTVEGVAQVIHRDLNAGLPPAIGPSAVSPSWGTPDEQIPPLPNIP
jgi:beta-lactamase class A